MTFHALRLPALAALAGLLAACHNSTSDVVSLGGNMYAVTRESTIIINRDVDKMKEEAETDAGAFCQLHGKQLQIVDVSEDKPNFRDGFVSVKVTFRALDQSATPAPAPMAMAPSMGSPEAAPAPSPAAPPPSKFYQQLKELEDLRKSGVITQDEFDAAKKKILENIQ